MPVRILVRETPSGRPIKHVEVRLESPAETHAGYTDGRGVTELPKVADGKYIVKIRSPNHRPYTEKTYISRHSIITINLPRAYD